MILTRRCARFALAALCACAAVAAGQDDELPLITVTADDTVIDRSCRVTVPEGVFIADANGDGVIHIAANDITVEFVEGGAELIQVPAGTPWHTLEGAGIRIDGYTGVTLRRPHAHRFKMGIWATEAHGLVIEAADVSGGYADRLRSTPERPDSTDILDPHANDRDEWRTRYGAGICIERSEGVTIRESFARRRQNGIVLDRCTGAKVYDNDFSFLSGWGLAMWRSTGAVISRNAFDFCIRGYNEGVYLDGQGAAGILMFEQCSDNVIAENSATHCGRGLWAFAGSEATGRTPPPDPMYRHAGRGCNDNLIIGNDFSFAAMRGLELTFSFNNRIIGNRFVECAASGVWAAWSQQTMIALNEFVRNGQRPSGLERGGVSIPHSAYNIIRDNTFADNRCGVHLWSEDDEATRQLGWHKANSVGPVANQVIRNTFTGDAVMLQVRDMQRTVIGGNVAEDVGAAVDAGPGSEPEEVEVTQEPYERPEYEAPGQRVPVGARDQLAGRDKIVLGDNFPWDHRRPIVRQIRGGPGDAEQVYELLGAPAERLEILGESPAVAELKAEDGRTLVHVQPAGDAAGYIPFRIALLEPAAAGGEGARGEEGGEAAGEADGAAQPAVVARHEFTGAFLRATWRTTFFKWGEGAEILADPQRDLDAWRARAVGPGAVTIDAPALDFRFAGAGPGALGPAPLKEAGFGADRFGLIARTRIPLPAGLWRFTTESDDGVRVLADGEPVIENWTRHAPTRNSGILNVEKAREVEIVVEHFEDHSYAVISLEIEPAGGSPAPRATPHDGPDAAEPIDGGGENDGGGDAAGQP
jgi:hypothetical protein